MDFSISEVRRHSGHQWTILALLAWIRYRRSILLVLLEWDSACELQGARTSGC